MAKASKQDRLDAAARARALLAALDDAPAVPDKPNSNGGSGSVPKRKGAPVPAPVVRVEPAGKVRPAGTVRGDGKGVVAPSGKQSKPADDNRSRAVPDPTPKTKAGYKFTQTAAAVLTVDPKHWPKKFKPGELKRGDSVWYHGDRYWVETASADFTKSCYARISNQVVRPEPHPCPSDAPDKNTETFCVHMDLLSIAPVAKRLYGPQPTIASIARAERAKTGQRDVGDEIATKLRACKTMEDTYEAASEYLEVPLSKLKEKYGHLNPGQQRMNLGNRMRNKWKKDHGK